MPCPCHAHAMPCCWGFRTSFPFDLYSAAMFDSHMPCRAHAMLVPCHDHDILKATSQGHGTAWHGHGIGMAWHVWISISRLRDGMWVTCPLSAPSGYHAEFHEGCNQKHNNPLHCRANSSDISGYHTDFQKEHGTVGEWQGRSMACVSGFSGLVVSMLASGTQDRGLEPSRSRQIFRAKKSSACLPSEGK
jgi:hypothetical protein